MRLPILRHVHKRYTVIPSELLQDAQLSLRDKGLLCYMLNLPDNWRFSVRGLTTVLKADGKSSVESGLRAIEKAGYIQRRKVRMPSGKIDWDWRISDIPEFLPCPGFPVTVKPDTENRSEYNTYQCKYEKNSGEKAEHGNEEAPRSAPFDGAQEPEQPEFEFVEIGGALICQRKQ